MSCQKGNTDRSRPQKYQNQTSFKNNLHDKSQKIKLINSIEIANVCKRCKSIIEWKIKYKKYKIPKAAMKCIKCEQKTVKHSYHNICLSCAKQQEICPKCGEKKEVVKGNPNIEEQFKLDAEFQMTLKTMSERKRRTFLRYMNQQLIKDKKNDNKQHTSGLDLDMNKTDNKDRNEDINFKSKEDLLIKLKLLAITEGDDIFNNDNESDDEKEHDNSDCD